MKWKKKEDTDTFSWNICGQNIQRVPMNCINYIGITVLVRVLGYCLVSSNEFTYLVNLLSIVSSLYYFKNK